MTQIAAALAVGCEALLTPDQSTLHAQLLETVQAMLSLEPDTRDAQAALLHSKADETLQLAAQLATLCGPICTLTALPAGERLLPLGRLVL